MSANEFSRRAFVRDGTLTAGALAVGAAAARADAPPQAVDKSAIRNFNQDMEYRACGRTGVMISAITLGGHWKRVNRIIPKSFPNPDSWLGVDIDDRDFQRNRHEVVTRCIDRGVNLVDCSCWSEIQVYARALKGRRDKMYVAWSWTEKEAKYRENRTAGNLVAALEQGLKATGEEAVDYWRLNCNIEMRGVDGKYLPAFSEAESEQIAKALEQAKKSGKARITGVASHDRRWMAYMLENFPEPMEAIVFPYTSRTKLMPQDGLFQAIEKRRCGVFAIKPFASNSLFRGDGEPAGDSKQHDDRTARLTLRYILCNPLVTAAVPGLASVDQVDNAALAALERRELDHQERADLRRATERGFARLPDDYQWLKQWDWV